MRSSCIASASLVAAALALQAIADPSPSTGLPAPELAAQTIHVRAWIDGRSHLILDDDTVQWQHFDFAAPGRLDCNIGEPIQATYIDGLEWWPKWPDLPDCENRFCGGCFSDVLAGLLPGIPDLSQLAVINPISVRGTCSVIEQPQPANNYRVVVEFDDNTWFGADWYEIDLVLEPSLGEPYCLSTPNSTGQSARISAAGSLSIAANDTYLLASACPPGCMGIFFYGAQELQMPFANGYLCINPLSPLQRVSALSCAGPLGEAQVHLDFPTLPPAGAILPGSTWCFQYWFRDPKAGGALANLTDGLRLTFLQ